MKVSDMGHDTYGAFRTRSHDNLVTAICLAVFYSVKKDSAGYFRPRSVEMKTPIPYD